MFKIDLSAYKESKQYIILFDILFKELVINKEPFLIEQGIAPSSYRRARNSEQNIGKQIVEKLARYTEYKMVSSEFINDLEKMLNHIYFNMYYKIYDTYDDDLKYINDLISENYLCFPIIKLFKIFLELNAQKDVSTVIEQNIDLFEEVKNYVPFFSKELIEIYDLVSVSFENNNLNKLVAKNYDNGMFYFTIAAKYLMNNKYLECLYYANIGKEMLLRDGNYKRIIYLNHKILNCYNAIKNYEACYLLANQQILTLRSFNFLGYDLGYEYTSTMKHLVISCLAISKFEEVIDLLKDKEQMTLTELSCLLVANYYVNKINYQKLYEELINECMDTKYFNIFLNINLYLTKREKKSLKVLSGLVTDSLITVLKELKEEKCHE